MSTSLLGDQFDVHGGAVDNLFPHHENELAQSEPLCGEPWVRYWLHPEHLDLKGVKMSKSLGNVIGVPELVVRHRYDQVRWFLAMNHYRTKMSFSDELIEQASEGYGKIIKLLGILQQRLEEADPDQLTIPVAGIYKSLRDDTAGVPRFRHHYTFGKFGQASEKFLERFRAGMDDDFNSPQATAALFDYVNELYAAGIESSDDTPSLLAAYRCIARHLYVLGCEFPNPRLYPSLAAECFPAESDRDQAAPYKALVDRLLELRQQARKSKDFARADLIRDLLTEAGVVVEDTPRGPRWELSR
jgi:cysteinyl-tRNA synthetase